MHGHTILANLKICLLFLCCLILIWFTTYQYPIIFNYKYISNTPWIKLQQNNSIFRPLEFRYNRDHSKDQVDLTSLKSVPDKLSYSEKIFRSSSSSPILWLDENGDPHWNAAAEREMYAYLLKKQTINKRMSDDEIMDECLQRPLFIIKQQGWGFFSRFHRFLEQFGQTLYSPWMSLLSYRRFSVSKAGRDDFLNEGIVRYFDSISTCSKFIHHSKMKTIKKRLQGSNDNSARISQIEDLLYENQLKITKKFRILNDDTVWLYGYEHIPHRRSLFDCNRLELDYHFSVSYLINHTCEHIYHSRSLSSENLTDWTSRNRPWGQSKINLASKSSRVTWKDRVFSSFLYYIFVLFFHQPTPRILQLTYLLTEHWSSYLRDKNGQSLNTTGGLFIRRGDKAREDSFWKKYKRWRNISMYVKGIVDEEKQRHDKFTSIFVMTDDVGVMKSIQDYANPESHGTDEPYAREHLRGRQILYNVFAPQACFDPFIRIGFEQFLVSFEFLIQHARFIVGHSDSNVGRHLEELMYARHQLNSNTRINSYVIDAPDYL